MNWIASQCGSPRSTGSKLSIASRKKCLRRSQLVSPRAPCRQGSRGAASSPRRRLRRSSARRAKSRQDRSRSSPRWAINSCRSRARIRADNGSGSCGLPLRPWARRSGMITRKPSARDALGMAEFDPVDLRVGEQPVEQHHRPPLAYFAPGELDAVGGGPIMDLVVAHRELARSPRPICRPAFDSSSVRISGRPRC